VAAPQQTPMAVMEKPAKAPDTRTITSLRIDPEILVRLKVAAARERVRVNEVVVDAIMDRLELLERRHRQGEAA
jgi:predicted HicB family RNase H-like nuclease